MLPDEEEKRFYEKHGNSDLLYLNAILVIYVLMWEYCGRLKMAQVFIPVPGIKMQAKLMNELFVAVFMLPDLQ